MEKLRDRIKNEWYLLLPQILLALQAVVFLIFREESYIQVHDNLDLFMAHYEMMKREGAFFSQHYLVSMLGGIDRDLLGSEWNLYNLMYVIFPGIWAYLWGYALKIAIGMFSFLLLAKEYFGERYEQVKPLAIVTACAFALIPVFPTYGIAFTSVPLLAYFLLRLHRAETRKALVKYYLLIFCYPFLSYFAYHGFFLLCYMAIGIVILWIVKRKFPVRLFVATALMSLGSMLFEYRLFRAMLFDDTVTIRSTMEHGHLTLAQALAEGAKEFFNASFHSEDSHTCLVLPVVLIGCVLINYGYIKRREAGKILHEPVNGLLLWIVLNCLNYGLYFFAPYRELVERLVPKLTGFEFSRTSYMNPFLWYAAFLLVLAYAVTEPVEVTEGNVGLTGGQVHLSDSSSGKQWRTAKSDSVPDPAVRPGRAFPSVLPALLATVSLLIVMFMPQMYNDFYYTCYNHAYRLLKHKETSTVNYREFYSTELFDAVKEASGYDYDYACAYGFHPSILNYNGIRTLDGYLGMYPQSYKEEWRTVIAPAMATSPSLAAYFEDWGARVWLMSASDENTYAPLRHLELEDERLVADIEALHAMGCGWIFSRIRFSNEEDLEEQNLHFVGEYEGYGSPYTIYVYRLWDSRGYFASEKETIDSVTQQTENVVVTGAWQEQQADKMRKQEAGV